MKRFNNLYCLTVRLHYIQTRGINGLRREGEKIKKSASKAAATHANIALGAGLFKLSFFIMITYLCYCNFVQKTALIFIYARKISIIILA
jgi:hypothetical protein